MLIFLKSHWKLVLIGVGLLILIVWVGSLTGMNDKLRNLLLKQNEEDLKYVLKIKEEHEKWYEDNISNLANQIEVLKKEKGIVQLETLRLKQIDKEKDAKIIFYQKEREAVFVSADPDKLVDELIGMGYRSAYKRPRRTVDK